MGLGGQCLAELFGLCFADEGHQPALRQPLAILALGGILSEVAPLAHELGRPGLVVLDPGPQHLVLGIVLALPGPLQGNLVPGLQRRWGCMPIPVVGEALPQGLLLRS
eukprot:7452866-Alexandrium_andersonii.AAC.1